METTQYAQLGWLTVFKTDETTEYAQLGWLSFFQTDETDETIFYKSGLTQPWNIVRQLSFQCRQYKNRFKVPTSELWRLLHITDMSLD